MSELGGTRGREWSTGNAPAVQSVGWRRTYTSSAGRFVDLKLESPTPRMVRLAYEGAEWDAGRVFLVRATIQQNIDGSAIRQTVLVPWQGIALAVPAGAAQLILNTDGGAESLPATPAAASTINVQLSYGNPGYNERRPERDRPTVAQSDGWYNATVIAERVFPPQFATSMRVYNVGPAILSVSNIAMGTAWTVAVGGVVEVPIPDPGFFDIATLGLNALCAITYRVTA